MPGIEIKGRSKIANYRHGGRTGKFGGGRTNLLEQLGRVEAEPSNRNRRAEISRVHGELNRGYAKGGRAGFAHGMSAAKVIGKRLAKKFKKKKVYPETEDLTHQVGPYVGDVGSERKSTKWITKKDKPTEWITKKDKPTEWITKKAEGGRIGLKHGSKKFVKGTKRQKQIHMVKDRPTEGTKLILHKGTKPYTPEGEKVGKRIGLKKGTDKKWIQKAVDPKHKGYCTPMTKKTCTPARKALARTFKKKAKTGWG